MDDTELGSLHGSQPTAPGRAEPQQIRRGEAFGRYVIVEKLGAGGMGVVYSAYDPELDRRVALKLLNPRGGGGSKASKGRARLLREAQALAKLNHPNVVTVHDVGEHDGRVFLAMEYVDGITLGAWIEAGPHPWHEVIEVLSAAGHGLMAAHAKDMTHRDFKPDNVMLTGEGPGRRVIVMDFGLATAPAIQVEPASLEESTNSSLASSIDFDSLTRTGMVLGTPAYMAPEQHSGVADAQADQFSFCVTLYEALYGSRPFAGQTLPELVAAATYGEIQAPPAGDTVPRWVREAVVRGLDADPARRWPTMAALIDALHDNPSRRRWLIGGAAGIVLTAAAVYGVGLLQERRATASCEREASALDDLWNDAQRQKLEQAFAASPLPYAGDAWSRTENRLDEEVETWSNLRMSTCLVRTSLEPGLWDVQDACFESRQRRLDNAVSLLSEPDAALIQRAAQLVELDTDPCADERWLETAPPLPTDSAARVRRQELQQDLDLGRALFRAGRYEDARSKQTALVEAALEDGERHLAAEARFELANALLELDQLAEGVGFLEDAYFEAKELSDDRLAGRAARKLVGAHGKGLGDASTGRLWARHAQILTDAEDQPTEQARLDLERSMLEYTAGEYITATKLAERAVTIFESSYGSYGSDTLNAKDNLARAYDRAMITDAARRMAREVLQARTESLGARHPATLRAHNSLAAVLISTDELDEAESHARASLDPETEPDLTTANHSDNLSLIFRQTGRLDEALVLNETVLQIRREQLPPRHVLIGHTLVHRSVILYSLGRVEEIGPLVDEAIEIYVDQGGSESSHLINTYRLRGAVLDAAGDRDAAIESFIEAANAQARALGPKHPDTVMIRVEVAQGVLRHGDYLRAIELCEPWVEDSKHRDDLPAGILVPLNAVYGRAHLIAGDPETAKASLQTALELAPTTPTYASWAPVLEIDLGRARWKTTADKDAAIADVEAALAKLKALDDADPEEIERTETWLIQTKR